MQDDTECADWLCRSVGQRAWSRCWWCSFCSISLHGGCSSLEDLQSVRAVASQNDMTNDLSQLVNPIKSRMGAAVCRAHGFVLGPPHPSRLQARQAKEARERKHGVRLLITYDGATRLGGRLPAHVASNCSGRRRRLRADGRPARGKMSRGGVQATEDWRRGVGVRSGQHRTVAMRAGQLILLWWWFSGGRQPRGVVTGARSQKRDGTAPRQGRARQAMCRRGVSSREAKVRPTPIGPRGHLESQTRMRVRGRGADGADGAARFLSCVIDRESIGRGLEKAAIACFICLFDVLSRRRTRPPMSRAVP